ncbi:hypothetical protein [Paenibacillus aquistagni]|uniref:hypothetical protein n=1 Tax=Paenibacillus aquistagni TaxID=1852522 RepID=UPI00145AEEC8|nr:hypothetical protein [Paenibacillus aquistagni]NMM52927.1 hypothetical protein [Paenibacillus aquistagni]
MHNTYHALQTKVGVISGRDAIYMDEYVYNCQSRELTVRGEFNYNQFSQLEEEGEAFIPFVWTFHNVLYVESTELDFYSQERLIEASFGLIQPSARLEAMREEGNTKLTEEHRHFVIATYDEVIEVIASMDYTLLIP